MKFYLNRILASTSIFFTLFFIFIFVFQNSSDAFDNPFANQFNTGGRPYCTDGGGSATSPQGLLNTGDCLGRGAGARCKILTDKRGAFGSLRVLFPEFWHKDYTRNLASYMSCDKSYSVNAQIFATEGLGFFPVKYGYPSMTGITRDELPFLNDFGYPIYTFYGMRFSAKLGIPSSLANGLYEIAVVHDDGIKVTLENKLLIDYPGRTKKKPHFACGQEPFILEQGKEYTLDVEYFQEKRNVSLLLLMRKVPTVRASLYNELKGKAEAPFGTTIDENGNIQKDLNERHCSWGSKKRKKYFDGVINPRFQKYLDDGGWFVVDSKFLIPCQFETSCGVVEERVSNASECCAGLIFNEKSKVCEAPLLVADGYIGGVDGTCQAQPFTAAEEGNIIQSIEDLEIYTHYFSSLATSDEVQLGVDSFMVGNPLIVGAKERKFIWDKSYDVYKKSLAVLFKIPRCAYFEDLKVSLEKHHARAKEYFQRNGSSRRFLLEWEETLVEFERQVNNCMPRPVDASGNFISDSSGDGDRGQDNQQLYFYAEDLKSAIYFHYLRAMLEASFEFMAKIYESKYRGYAQVNQCISRGECSTNEKMLLLPNVLRNPYKVDWFENLLNVNKSVEVRPDSQISLMNGQADEEDAEDLRYHRNDDDGDSDVDSDDEPEVLFPNTPQGRFYYLDLLLPTKIAGSRQNQVNQLSLALLESYQTAIKKEFGVIRNYLATRDGSDDASSDNYQLVDNSGQRVFEVMLAFSEAIRDVCPYRPDKRVDIPWGKLFIPMIIESANKNVISYLERMAAHYGSRSNITSNGSQGECATGTLIQGGGAFNGYLGSATSGSQGQNFHSGKISSEIGTSLQMENVSGVSGVASSGSANGPSNANLSYVPKTVTAGSGGTNNLGGVQGGTFAQDGGVLITSPQLQSLSESRRAFSGIKGVDETLKKRLEADLKNNPNAKKFIDSVNERFEKLVKGKSLSLSGSKTAGAPAGNLAPASERFSQLSSSGEGVNTPKGGGESGATTNFGGVGNSNPGFGSGFGSAQSRRGFSGSSGGSGGDYSTNPQVEESAMNNAVKGSGEIKKDKDGKTIFDYIRESYIRFINKTFKE